MYYKAISLGNADTLAIWNVWNGAAWVAAGSLPTTTDDVYTNGYIVTVTTSQAYLSWNRSSVAAPLSIMQGGQFQIDGANAITTQGTVNGGNINQTSGVGVFNGACIYRKGTHIAKWVHNGNLIGGTAPYNKAVINESNSDIDIYGNISGGSSSNGMENYLNSSNIAIYGNLTGVGTYGSCFRNDLSSGKIIIIGNVYGGTTALTGLYLNTSTSNVDIIGNIYGGSTSVYGIANLGSCSGIINITGNVYGGVAGSAIYGGWAGELNITGIIEAAGQAAITWTAAGCVISIVGNVLASVSYNGIYNNSTSVVILTGNIKNKLAIQAISSPRLFLNVTPTTVWEFSDFGGNPQYLYGAGSNTGMPPEDKVEDGYVYGANDEFEGTLVQPPFTIADFIAALKADELGIRLGKCATTEEVDSTVKAFENNV